jgi:hypothetical protein
MPPISDVFFGQNFMITVEEEACPEIKSVIQQVRQCHRRELDNQIRAGRRNAHAPRMPVIPARDRKPSAF